jgi:hypothetical protein
MIARDPKGRWIGAIARAIVLVALFLVVWVTSQFLVGSSEIFTPAASSPSLETISKLLEAGIASVDQAVSMLTAVQLSVFILVGFVLRGALTTAQRPTLEQMIAGAVFLVCSFASLTLGYGARIQSIGIVNSVIGKTYSGFGAVQTTVVHQAFFVVVSAISAVYLIVVALLDTSEASSPAKPSPTDPITLEAEVTSVVVTADVTNQHGLGQAKGGF